MTEWTSPIKPAEITESRIIEAILDGTFPINSTLPPERELAEMLGVTRPTLREALQRLSRDGWIEIRQGKATRVKDYMREGNLLILNAITRSQKNLPANFIPDLLHIRLLLAPEYMRLATQNSPSEVIRFLESIQGTPDTAQDFTRADFELHYRMTVLSENPVFTLIFNGFGDLYRSLGLLYFSSSQTRDHSRSYYKKLLSAVLSNDVFLVGEVTRQVMQDSIDLWNHAAKGNE